MRPLVSLIDHTFHTLHNTLQTHCRAIKLGTICDIFTANKTLIGYLRCHSLTLAHKLFDEMSFRDIVSWNTMLSGYVNTGDLEKSLEVLKLMRKFEFEIDGYTFGSVLKGVALACNVDIGQQIHGLIVKLSYGENVYVGSALLDMYAKCENVGDAFLVFQGMPERNSVSWNAIISGFVKVGDFESVFWLLSCMEKDGVCVDDGTFSPVLTLLDDEKFFGLAMQLHCKILKHGLEVFYTVCNALISSYSECGSLDDAKKVFDFANDYRDVVMWNSMLAAYLVHDKVDDAMKLFLDMQVLGFEPDVYTYTSVVSACFEKAHKDHGRSLHGLVIKRGLEQLVPICNAIIAMYLKSNNKLIEDALNVFNSMEMKDRVSWNSILTGLSQNGFSEEALDLFRHMRYLLVEIDHYAFSAVLRSCSNLAMLQLGQEIHALTIKFGFESNDFVASSLIFMYSKSGFIEEARKSFEETSRNSSIIWNSFMFAYAQHGDGNAALDIFYQMREKKVKLDHITFVAVLTACSHIGSVEKGRYFLKSMESDYGIPPRMEHYACAVDLFGRAGNLDEAKALIESMAFKPDAMVLKTFLGACRACGNIELATKVASHLLELEPEDHTTYVILSNMYSHLKRWDEKASVTKLMRERHVKKVPGWSWIEVQNEVHAFIAEDKQHSDSEQIYEMLSKLMQESKWLDSNSTECSYVQDDDVHLWTL